MAGIPISQLVRVTPSVVAPAPGAGPLNSLILSTNAALADVRFKIFTTASSVGTFFGVTSTEYQQATVFFTGYTGATNLPSQLIFAYQSAGDAAMGASLVGGSVAGITLSALQALNGALDVTVGGTAITATVNLSGVASLSAVAALIATALGNTVTCTYDSENGVFVIGTVATGSTASIGYASGPVAVGLNLTQANGATIQPGEDASGNITETMNYLANAVSFSGFTTAYAPSAADLLALAVWTAAQNNTVAACLWDTSAAATTEDDASSFGATVMAQAYSGVLPIYKDPLAGLFPLAVMSSLNFGTTNGRQSLAYRSNSLITPSVTDGNTSATLLGNGYSFYGAFAGESAAYQFFYNGQIGGPFKWFDSFICQIKFNADGDAALVSLLTQIGQIPFNAQGDTLIEAALQDPVNSAINFGTIRQGVTLSASEAAEVNAAAGKAIDSILSTQGYYISPGASAAAASVREARGPIVPQIWYTDGESVQTINLSSVDVL